MKVGDLMTRSVATCRPGETLAIAAQRMWDHDCGCIPVVSDDTEARVVGILTDRDVCMATHFRNAPPAALSVGEVMTREVRTIGPEETPSDAEAVMRDAQIRRLPVIDEEQRLLGVVSLADLARVAARQRRSRKAEVTERELGETLEAICAARAPAHAAPSA